MEKVRCLLLLTLGWFEVEIDVGWCELHLLTGLQDYRIPRNFRKKRSREGGKRAVRSTHKCGKERAPA
jgi:hypothetical protein